MIPHGLSDAHLEKAAAEISASHIPFHRESVYYDVLVNGKFYPPKYLISVAARIAFGKEHPPDAFNAVEAKLYFEGQGYEVRDRRLGSQQAIADEDDESAFPEGTERFALHRRLERDRAIAGKAKAKRLEDTGKLECEACGTNFFTMYGDLGEGFIEAHHTKPVATLDGKQKTKITDLAMVCSNCHRMLHRSQPLLSVGQLREIVDQNR